jgi:hypothetical protein
MPDNDITLDLPGVGETSIKAVETTGLPEAAGVESEALAEPASDVLTPVETLATARGVPAWKLAGLMRHQRWAAGKAVTAAEFDAALAAFAGRPLGGGR